MSHTVLVIAPDRVKFVDYAKTIQNTFQLLSEVSDIADVLIFLLLNPGMRYILRMNIDLYVSQRVNRKCGVAVIS